MWFARLSNRWPTESLLRMVMVAPVATCKVAGLALLFLMVAVFGSFGLPGLAGVAAPGELAGAWDALSSELHAAVSASKDTAAIAPNHRYIPLTLLADSRPRRRVPPRHVARQRLQPRE